MDLALNLGTWDLDLKNGDLYLVMNVDDFTQYVGQKLKLWLGEWSLDQSAGVAYYDLLLVKDPNARAINDHLIEQVSSIPGITAILSWNLQMDSSLRQLQLTFTAQCTAGTINFDQLLGG